MIRSKKADVVCSGIALAAPESVKRLRRPRPRVYALTSPSARRPAFSLPLRLQMIFRGEHLQMKSSPDGVLVREVIARVFTLPGFKLPGTRITTVPIWFPFAFLKHSVCELTSRLH